MRIAMLEGRGAKLLKGNRMRKLFSCLSSILLIVLPIFAEMARASDNDDRLRNSGAVLKGSLDVSDDIPRDLLDRAACVVVFPSVIKASPIGGAGHSYGRGAMSCRQGDDFKGSWGAPTMMVLEGGSFGFQIGQKTADLLLLVMNECSARGIMNGKVNLGVDASVAAGPIGRDSSAGSD